MPADPVIVAARRTPIGVRGHALATLRVEQLAAPVVRAALDDARATLGADVHPADVVLGNCMGPGGNPARLTALAAGLGVMVPGVTVDRQCGSGLTAILDAATAIRAGDARPRVAGGVESASTAPVRSIDGIPYARAPFAPEGWPDPGMVRAAEDLAVADAISRQRQDEHAARSHRRARAAHADGRFAAELVPLGTHRHAVHDAALNDTAVHDTAVDDVVVDEALRRGEPPFHRLPPLFPGGSVTAGTSTRFSDGAAAVVVVPGAHAAGRAGLALRAHAVVGCDPALPGIGAAPAVHAVLSDAGVTVEQVAAFEIVEAFAAQSLAVLDRLGIDAHDPRVCADGGALALGHPWGASGAVSMVRLFSRLVRGGAPAGTLGIAAASVGGGLGVAALVEVVR